MEELRITNHPIMGVPKKGREINFTFDGKILTGYEGEPISIALKSVGIKIHRYTRKHASPRGVFCAIGRCTDCVMVVNGEPNVRTCITPLEENMIIETQYGVSSQTTCQEEVEAQ